MLQMCVATPTACSTFMSPRDQTPVYFTEMSPGLSFLLFYCSPLATRPLSVCLPPAQGPLQKLFLPPGLFLQPCPGQPLRHPDVVLWMHALPRVSGAMPNPALYLCQLCLILTPHPQGVCFWWLSPGTLVSFIIFMSSALRIGFYLQRDHSRHSMGVDKWSHIAW